jgi:hypothetical protein
MRLIRQRRRRKHEEETGFLVIDDDGEAITSYTVAYDPRELMWILIEDGMNAVVSRAHDRQSAEREAERLVRAEAALIRRAEKACGVPPPGWETTVAYDHGDKTWIGSFRAIEEPDAGPCTCSVTIVDGPEGQ